MTSQPTHTDSDQNLNHHHDPQIAVPVKEVEPVENISTEVKPSEDEADNTANRIELPEPDAENITVLTHKLPNKPILPWNHYDSPWEESETEEKETTLEQVNINDEQKLDESEDMDEVE